MAARPPKQKPDYLLEVMDGEILLYHPSRTAIFYLNPTAALIWRLCDGQRTRQEIAAMLAEAYPDAQQQIVVEVDATLRQLAEQGVIEFA